MIRTAHYSNISSENINNTIDSYLNSDDYNHFKTITSIDKNYNTLYNNYLRNIRIEGIPETYSTNNINALNREGTLCIAIPIGNNLYDINIYDLFESETGIRQNNIPFVVSGFNNLLNPILENYHRIILQKDINNNYYVKNILLGKENNNYLFSMDIPSYKRINDNSFSDPILPRSDGYFINNENTLNVYWIYLSYKPFLNIKSSENGITINIENSTSGTDMSKMTKLNINNTNNNYYIIDYNFDNLIDNNELSYINFSVSGTDSSSDEILLEFF